MHCLLPAFPSSSNKSKGALDFRVFCSFRILPYSCVCICGIFHRYWADGLWFAVVWFWYVSHVFTFVCYSQDGVSENFCQYTYVVTDISNFANCILLIPALKCTCWLMYYYMNIAYICLSVCLFIFTVLSWHVVFIFIVLSWHVIFLMVVFIGNIHFSFLYSLCCASGLMSSCVVLLTMSDDGLVLGFFAM